MAATDQTYRSQRTLDVVFGVSCILMLASLVWMFAQDYFREYKVEIRDFRDVEEALADRELVRKVPDQSKVAAAEEAVKQARAERDQIKAKLEKDAKDKGVKKTRDEARAQEIKAEYDSKVSLYNIEVEKRNAADPNSSFYQSLSASVDRKKKEVDDLAAQLDAKQKEVEEDNRGLDELRVKEFEANKKVEAAEKQLKDLTDEFDRWAKLAAQKRWKTSDRIRTLPVIDAFASPTKIDQIVLNDLPIDYNFKQVTRYDRCATCHQGIDRASFDRQNLEELTKPASDADRENLARAKEMLENRRKLLGTKVIDFNPNDLRLREIPKSELTDARVSQFSAHPRLDVFVGDKSPHPKEKFGCTICHAGQGSATEFNLASHTPNDWRQREQWEKAHDWESNHFWDFPMLPKRFIESSCLKCHYQVTDLLPHGEEVDIRAGKPVEGPGTKVVRGYNLIRENGCFGCHEISGVKSGREVGPDLRLEPNPPLEAMTQAERNKMTADPLNLPGTMRKVGPSLKRISEKTNQEWVRRWLEAPRAFRPDTKMPHFYNLSNNRKEVLPDNQKDFPDVEIHGIAYYLFHESRDYLQGKDTWRVAGEYRQKELEQKKKDNIISEAERKELEEITRRLELAGKPEPIAKKLIAGDGNEVELPAWLKDEKARDEHAKNGRILFTERGCLACHSHAGVTQAAGDVPAVSPKAHFGPNLSELAAKIAPEGGDPEARYRWLVQWILNPTVHFSRTRMPITHLTAEQAAEVAAWLLSQRPKEWKQPDPPAPSEEALEKLARVWLEKATSRLEAASILKQKGLTKEQEEALRVRTAEADELRLASSRAGESWADKLKWYVGRKAITQLGCYGCHDIPGFDYSKPIGTALNDWGKKDPERLAFEDVVAYVKKHHHIVDERDDANDPAKAAADWKASAENGRQKSPYERFFFDALDHHRREGFLHQKLMEPRSYDYDRLRSWEDRLRMPQFRFSRTVVGEDATAEEKAQAERDEAEAREAVMTFVLGLVAEPVPPQFVNKPAPEKLAVAKGKHLLEKYNCVGCHQVQPGRYEFKFPTDPEKRESLLDSLGKLVYDPKSSKYESDHRELFKEQNEWTSRLPAQENRLTLIGMPGTKNDKVIRLTEAARFLDAKNRPQDIPASNELDTEDLFGDQALISRRAPEGGDLVSILLPYLPKRDKLYDDEKNARAALPPPLLREGEKVQPDWLFQFLRNPFEIRPMTVLRMPKFNMTEQEAMDLVNYFAAVDKIRNPNGGLVYPYAATPQRDESFWVRKTAEYVTRLKENKLLQGRRDQLKKELTQLPEADRPKGGVEALLKQWETEGAYATDAYRLLTSYNTPCLGCHNVGNLPAKQPRNAQGPPLDLAWLRLRPEWTARWIANPERMISYPTPMPANFRKGKDRYPEFDGDELQQLLAVRDVLMFFPKVVEMPANRAHKPAAPGGDAK
jgi:mono/diheme cytochrome c family protein